MSIHFQILGQPGQDNAALVRVETGHSITRLLFDCGEGCLADLPFGEIQAIDHLFFSHLHMDHVAGFDSFFRCLFNRETIPNRIWGPAETAPILHHRFQGYLWNLHEEMPAVAWRVTEIDALKIQTTRFELKEAFVTAHEEGAQPHPGTILHGSGFTVEAAIMDHKTPTVAYIVRETVRRNIDAERLKTLGLRPGPWVKQLKEANPGGVIEIEGASRSVDELQAQLLTESPGESVAYLTDFLLDEPARARLANRLRGCQRIICEAQYRHADAELARRHFHLTAAQSASIAQSAGAEELTLFHVSQRYDRAIWLEMLEEARAIFPATQFPAHWDL